MLSVRPLRMVLLLGGLVAAGVGASAQARWAVDAKASLAWWQVNPHLNHLWATTCPEEPSWRPGEGRSSGWVIGKALGEAKHGYAGVSDTTIIPLYPRYEALPICTEAVTGEILVGDTVGWRRVRGEVAVRAEALITGEERRDAFTRQAVLHTDRYPEIRFTIDSVVNVTRQGDTLRGKAVGVFSLHGVSKPMTASIRAWPEADGLRVLGKFRVLASTLVPDWGLSSFALGLGVGVRIWQELYMGVDLVLRHPRAGAN